MYPDQCDDFFKTRQLHLLGASLGFFVAGPLGLLLGAWLVHFTAQKLNVVAQQAETVQNAAKTLISPFTYVKNFFVRVKDTAADVFDVLSQMEPNFTFPDAEEDEDEEQKEEESSELEKQSSTSVAFPIAESSPVLSWFYQNFSLLPPVIPRLPTTQSNPLAYDDGDTPESMTNKNK